MQVRIHVVTFRRPHLLERALKSLISQTCTSWVCEVLNDDPADCRVAELIDRIGDSRIRLSLPQIKRGGTGNFNYAFRRIDEPFTTILEDDNWWEPSFLDVMLNVLSKNANATAACCNERVWRECKDGSWVNTKATIWPISDVVKEFPFRLSDKCGSAKICNSAMLYRTNNPCDLQTPASIPIDVTEHFRERIIPHPIILVYSPLVNYAETLTTHRSQDSTWAVYQNLLIASVFILSDDHQRRLLADELWQRARSEQPFLKTALLAVGCSYKEGRILWRQGSVFEKMRYLMHVVRHPVSAFTVFRSRSSRSKELQWLLNGAFAEFVRKNSKNISGSNGV